MSKKLPASIKEFVKQIRTVNRPLCLSIVSLGNPNTQFANTRHNAGHMALESIKKEMIGLGPSTDETLRGGYIATTFEEHPDLTLFQSGTYMNESSKAISTMLKWQKSQQNIIDVLDPTYVHSILILHDDVDLNLGEVKFKAGGKGSHGHNGLRSIIDSGILKSAPSNYLSDSSFPRIRIGIGRPDRGEVSDFVLKRFRPDEKSIFFSTTVPDVIDILTQLFYSGIFKSFNSDDKVAN